MADHPLRPATDRRLGGPLPHQQANPTRAPRSAINLSPTNIAANGAYTVLAAVSRGCSVPSGRFPRVTHPSATLHRPEGRLPVRLACVRHAASVRSEPGSNSHVDLGSNQNTQTDLSARPGAPIEPSKLRTLHVKIHHASPPEPLHKETAQTRKHDGRERTSPIDAAAHASLPIHLSKNTAREAKKNHAGDKPPEPGP